MHQQRVAAANAERLEALGQPFLKHNNLRERREYRAALFLYR